MIILQAYSFLPYVVASLRARPISTTGMGKDSGVGDVGGVVRCWCEDCVDTRDMSERSSLASDRKVLATSAMCTRKLSNFALAVCSSSLLHIRSSLSLFPF